MLKGMIRSALAREENKVTAFIGPMMQLPIPIVGMISDMFLPVNNNFPNKEDTKRWEALSPVGLADCFSSPIVITHVTSDVLVPVDQISRRYTHPDEGETMPKGFSTRLPMDYPGVLSHSLEDEMPAELTQTRHITISDPDEDSVLPYDVTKPFNLNIYDDGPTESYASHRAKQGIGIIDDVPYLKEMLGRTLAKNEMLIPNKLRLLLERYQGQSIQLPAHTGIDDDAYGSLKMYQLEVAEELANYVNNHSLEELDTAMQEVTAVNSMLISTWEIVRQQLIEQMKP